MLMSLALGALPAGARRRVCVHERPRPVMLRCVFGRRVSDSQRARAFLLTQPVDSWKAAELRDTGNFRFFSVCVRALL